jgi:hypothetical protein
MTILTTFIAFDKAASAFHAGGSSLRCMPFHAQRTLVDEYQPAQGH